MAENQKTQEPNLEDKLSEIGSLMHLNRKIGKSKGAEERVPLYQNLAMLLSGGDRQLFKDAYGDIRLSPEEALRYAAEGVQTRIKDTKPVYDKNKNKIIKEVVSAMKNDVKSAKDVDEAAENLSRYLIGLFQIPELDQVIADNYAQGDATQELGVSMNFSARGSIEKYRGRHEGLYARTIAREYLKENKDKDKTTYTVDEDKIGKIMDKVEGASLLYANYINLKAMKEAMKQKEQK